MSDRTPICSGFTIMNVAPIPNVPVMCSLEADHPGKHWDKELGIEFDSDQYGKATKLDI